MQRLHTPTRDAHSSTARWVQRQQSRPASTAHSAPRVPQRTGLVGRDHGGAAHGLAGGQLPHQYGLFHHAAHGVGEGQRDGEGQALGHHCHHEGHSDHHKVEDAGRDARIAAAALRHEVGPQQHPEGEQTH